MWFRRLTARLAALPRLKTVCITSGMTAFFLTYFVLLNIGLFPATEMPVTRLDRMIAFSPHAIWLYASLWVYVVLVPSLLDTPRDLLVYYISAATICILGFGVFLFWPTLTPPADIDWSQFPLYRRLKAVDRSGNAFPSLHACFSVFSCIWLDGLLRRIQAPSVTRVFNAAWCAGILYSTLATRQHVAIDMFSGIALGIAGSALQARVDHWILKPPEMVPAMAGET